MKRLVLDLDDTLTLPPEDGSKVGYADLAPCLPMVERVREYKEMGFEIVICSARNMRTYNNSIGHINANTLPVIIDWLRKHDIPYDEIHVGKPWCGHDGFYVDDKAVRPSEFLTLGYDDLRKLTDAESSTGKLKKAVS